ncbi:hypothetical protein [Chryseobacterium scophthalmum]|uniref:hypothetical protein n=1 Tax=Chryseobacterium scophthalmum TaxID=59733 RepID=UPI000C9E728A|nr:hypothetical protein [Chryseobacterium scophthalmum]
MQIKLGLIVSLLSLSFFTSQIRTGKKIRTVQFEKNVSSVKKKDGNKITTKKCTEFPFEVGCKNNEILELQKCLGLPLDGVLGARTMKMLKDYGNDLPDNKLTFDVWGNIILSCGDSNNGGLVNISSENTRGIDLSNNYGNTDVVGSPNSFYKNLLKNGMIDTVFTSDGKDTLIRYNGVELSEIELGKLDTAMKGMNFIRMVDNSISGTYLFKRIVE